MKPKLTLEIYKILLLVVVFLSFLFLTLLGIVGSINAFVLSMIGVSLLYAVRIKRNRKWIVNIIPLVMVILGIIFYIMTLLLDGNGDSFGVGLLLIFAIILVLLGVVTFMLYRLLETSYYSSGTYQKIDQSYLTNEWILFTFVFNMLIFQVIGFLRFTPILQSLLQILLIGVITFVFYWILRFINQKKSSMELFTLSGMLFIGAYIGYAYIARTYIPFLISSAAHLLLIYFLMKDHVKKLLKKKVKSS